MGKVLKSRQVAEKLNCCIKTLDRYCKSGKLHPVKFGESKTCSRYFDYDEVVKLIPNFKEQLPRKIIAYTRVSTQSQKSDLGNQIKFIENWVVSKGICIDEYLSDIGSGINYKRKNFLKIIDMITNNEVQEIIVSHRDRLTRFGFEMIEHLALQHDVKITIINIPSTSPEQEVVNDLMEIIHVFSSRLYGLRKYKIKKEDLLSDEKSKDSNLSE